MGLSLSIFAQTRSNGEWSAPITRNECYLPSYNGANNDVEYLRTNLFDGNCGAPNRFLRAVREAVGNHYLLRSVAIGDSPYIPKLNPGDQIIWATLAELFTVDYNAVVSPSSESIITVRDLLGYEYFAHLGFLATLGFKPEDVRIVVIYF